MTVYLLYYDKDDGDNEDWNVFYTPVEVFLDPRLREMRKIHIKSINPDYEFNEEDIEVSEVVDAQVLNF